VSEPRKEHEPYCPRAQFWDAGEYEAPCRCGDAKPREIPVVFWATEEQLDKLVAQVRVHLAKPEADLITLAVFQATHRKPGEESWVGTLVVHAEHSLARFAGKRCLVVPLGEK